MSTRSLAAVMTLLATSCTGASWGENTPGGDTYVDPQDPLEGEHRMGAIAVEPDEDQLWVVHEEMRSGVKRAHLSAIDPVSGRSKEVLDVSGTTDRRVVFPADDRMILLAQHGSSDQLVLLDTRTRTRLASVSTGAWYHGTRTSPSGRALVVADNNQPDAPLHVIDTTTLGHQVIAHGGEAIEAMWNHHSDVLFAVSATEPFGDSPVVRIHRYDLTGADLAAALPAPTRTWELPGLGWDFLFSYTWISISPDDRWVVFPLIDRRPVDLGEPAPEPGDSHVLVVLDQTTGTLTQVPGSGPVGFTRDSRTIVSYGWREEGPAGQDLWLIDPVARTRDVVAMPFDGTIMFHASRDSDHIVCAPVIGTGSPAIYDLAAEVVRGIAAPTLRLYDFVTRPGHGELWLQSQGSVFALTLAISALAEVDLGGKTAGTINVRPAADQAVIGDTDHATIQRFAMATQTRTGDEIVLPSPFEGVPVASLPTRVAAPVAAYAQSPFDPAYVPSVTRRPGRWREAARADGVVAR